MIKKTLIVLFYIVFIILSDMRSASAGSMRENIEENYLSLKESIEADTDKDRLEIFDEDIDRAKREMGIGFNFGNSLEWAFDNSKVRRYKLRISIGFDNDEYFYYESYVNMDGNLFGNQNRGSAEQPYAELALIPNATKDMKFSDQVNRLWIQISNKYPEASLYDVLVDVNYLNIINKDGNEILSEPFVQKRITASVGPENELVVSIPVNTTVGNLYGRETILQADIQLDGFISDYKNNPGLVYKDSYNGEPATDEELAFLKEQGFRTIRMPVTWYAHMDAGGTVDPEWFDEVKRIVDRILSYDFYVIINIHHDAGKKGWIWADEADFQNHEMLYRYLVLQIAESFKHYGPKLILSGPNEVINSRLDTKIYALTPESDINAFNRINQIFVEEVRRTGYANTNRFLIVGAWFANVKTLEKIERPDDRALNKIFTEFHVYPITEENVLSTLEYLEQKDMSDFSEFNLIMTEFGILRDEELEKRIEFMRSNVSFMAQYDIPVILWDDGGGYALMDREYPIWDTKYDSNYVAEAVIAAAAGK